MVNKYESLFLATTDTVVGMGAPISEANEKTINKLKQRPDHKQLVIMVSSIAMAKKFYGDQGFGAKARELAEKIWPGAVTLVCSEKLALRMPDCSGLLSLIDMLGPIYMTSANLSGQPPMSLDEAKKTFPEIQHYYDFGPGSGQPSQILDVNTKEILRN